MNNFIATIMLLYIRADVMLDDKMFKRRVIFYCQNKTYFFNLNDDEFFGNILHVLNMTQKLVIKKII